MVGIDHWLGKTVLIVGGTGVITVDYGDSAFY